MKKSLRIIALLLVLVMCLPFALTACDDDEKKDPGDEYTLPLEDGYNQLTLYWNNKDGEYANCDIWLWYGDVAGKGYLFHECSYGGKVVVNIPEDVSEVGFIVRKNCSEPGGSTWGVATKDATESDRFAVIDGRETVIYLKSGDQYQYTSNDGGKTLTQIKKLALSGIVDQNKVKFSVTPKVTINSLDQVKIYEGDRELEVTAITNKTGKTNLIGRTIDTAYVTVNENFDLGKNYRIVVEGYGERPIVPTDIFDSKFFAENYHYDGNDLGAVINGDNTTFKVWAPTASKVVLNLFEEGNDCDAYKTVEMVRGDKGVWSHTEACGHGTYYTYSVTTSVGTQEAVDPYAKAAGVNGRRGMVVDLALTNPTGWGEDTYRTDVDSYSEAIIWEIHVRDFSNKISTSQYKGKYLAFTERGLVNEHGQPIGVDYLVELGITHVHLLPSYDFASVDETKNNQFNWGYDPQNYNVPEGSYSTDPYNGEVRIQEYKKMVQALHEAGIGVVMDVVYNHTYDANSNLNKIVPYYYYRYTSTGANSSASGCGNDTASERYMFGKYMVDSTSYWMEEYHLDGFRFDLMGLHDLQTMQEVESAVHTINPNALIYGEGWTMGETIDGSKQANQSNISRIEPTGDAIGGIAVFNDAIRDGLKGSVFDEASRGYISGDASLDNWNKVFFGIIGGSNISGTTWTVNDSMVINYMSAHDNNTLWDKLQLSNGSDSDADRNKMNNLGAAIIMVSKGTPFWQAGEEMLRTKPTEDGGFDHNSYMSSDEVNNIDWSVLDGESRQYQTMVYYKGLIEMRKAFGIFSDNDTVITAEKLNSGVVILTYSDGNGGEAKVVINPHKQTLPITLEGNWNLVANGEQAGSTVITTETGSVNADAVSIRVYVNDALLGE